MKKWKLIAALTDQSVLGTAGLSDRPSRKKARAILQDEDGRYALIHEAKTNLYMLPGGSIEHGEDEEAAIRRELLEETGCTCDRIKPLGIITENRYHADETRLTYFFIVCTKSRQAVSHFTAEEAALGTEVLWCPLEQLFELIGNFPCTSNSQKFLQARDLAALHEYTK